MAPPPSWIVVSAHPSNSCPIQNVFDAATQPTGRLRLLRPDRVKDRCHGLNIDLRHRFRANKREGIFGQSAAPLGAVFFVAPLGFMGRDESKSGVLEVDERNLLRSRCLVPRLACFSERVTAKAGEFPDFRSLRARFGERGFRVGAKPLLPLLAASR